MEYRMSKQLTPRETQINTGLALQHKMIKSLFGDEKKANKFTATAVKVANDYKLSECHPNSIIDACITVAQMNLDLSPALAHAYIVPFKKSVQLIVSARGYTALLARTGWKIKSYIVNAEDEFEYFIDNFNESIKFKKNIDSETETFKYAVALAQSPDGTLFVEIMNVKQIDKHRKVSSNQKGAKPTGVWADWFNEMATKTVIKKLVKKLPIGEEIANVVEKDDKPIELKGKVIEEPKKEEPIDLNSLGTAPIKETVIPTKQPIDIEVQIKTPTQQMKEKLVELGVKELKAEEWCMDNVSVVQMHLDEPSLIETVAEQLC
jgi:recombination protein RecT